MKKIVALFFISLANAAFGGSNEIAIPRSEEEPCRYYLTSAAGKGGGTQVIHKQVCPKNELYSGIGYSTVEIDCKTKKFKELGYGDDSVKNIKSYPKNEIRWARAIKGSSKSDLVEFVCKTKPNI